MEGLPENRTPYSRLHMTTNRCWWSPQRTRANEVRVIFEFLTELRDGDRFCRMGKAQRAHAVVDRTSSTIVHHHRAARRPPRRRGATREGRWRNHRVPGFTRATSG